MPDPLPWETSDWCGICGEHLDMKTGGCPSCAPIRVVDRNERDRRYYDRADEEYQKFK